MDHNLNTLKLCEIHARAYPPSMRISMLSRSSAVRWANSGGRRTQVLPAVTESSRRCFSAKMLGSQCLYLHNAVPVCAQSVAQSPYPLHQSARNRLYLRITKGCAANAPQGCRNGCRAGLGDPPSHCPYVDALKTSTCSQDSIQGPCCHGLPSLRHAQ